MVHRLRARETVPAAEPAEEQAPADAREHDAAQAHSVALPLGSRLDLLAISVLASDGTHHDIRVVLVPLDQVAGRVPNKNPKEAAHNPKEAEPGGAASLVHWERMTVLLSITQHI